MTDPQQALDERFRQAAVSALGLRPEEADPVIRPAQNPRFGDFQANGAMALAKKLGQPPRKLAESILGRMEISDLCEAAEIAGPGFINFRILPGILSQAAQALARDVRLGIPVQASAERVVVDYSSPNVAKEMHVGHLRSTVIGDALVRVLSFLGHPVVRQNHLGDWGTQFGMLIEHLLERGVQEGATEELTVFYQEAKKRDDEDPAFAERARRRVVALQQGDEQTLEHWKRLIALSRRHFNQVYGLLDVQLCDEDLRGESFYNRYLQPVVDELAAKGLIQGSDGAQCVFVPGYEGADGRPVPLIVRKSDGGFGYAATDLAALRYRLRDLGAERVVYVVDARQSDHFQMVFWTARAAQWLDDRVRAEHVRFGTVLGEDGRPIKTREGKTIPLIGLLEEACERAAGIVREKSPDLSADEQERVARIVGIGAVKYADLSNDRVKDYVFSWDRMLAMEGNTAPYLQYAVARIRSIFRKAGLEPGGLREEASGIEIGTPEEKQLLLQLLQMGPVVRAVGEHLEPHRLCHFLFELASQFSRFYEACPVLKAETPQQRHSRLVLCDLTARAMELGLGLLGIRTPDRM